MEKNNFLINMTDFVLEYAPKFNPFGTDEQILCLDYIHNYAKFLKQPLKLEMFVPCDDEGNIYAYEYEEPIQEDYWSENGTVYSGELFKHDLNRYMKYKQAKEKVLFEGFKVIKQDNITITIEYDHFQLDYNKVLNVFANHRTIEDLAKYNFIELTENTIKQIGL